MTDDERLIALIDNELDEDARTSLLARLAQDEALRARADALREARGRLVASFDSLLEQAPLARLRAALPPLEAAVRPASRRPSFAWRDLAAGIAIGLIVAGLAGWIGFAGGWLGEREDWRSAVIEYMQLYTPATFALANPDDAVAAKQLQAVSAKVGVGFTPENTALPGLRYRIALNLAYRGAPWPKSPIRTPRASRRSSASPPTAKPRRLSARSRAAILPTRHGRRAAAATWSSAACPRARSRIWRKLSRRGSEEPR